MGYSRRVFEATALAVFLVAGLGAAWAASSFVLHVHSIFSALDVAGPRGRADLLHRAATGRARARDLLRLRLCRLRAGETYRLVAEKPGDGADAPVPFEPIDVRASRRGVVEMSWDSERDDALPFGAEATRLAGCRIEVRDANGGVVLEGTFPECR